MNPVLSLVDTAVVGQHSALELAAMGPSVMLCDHLGRTSPPKQTARATIHIPLVHG